MHGIYIDLIVPNIYKTIGAAGNSSFRIPMFNEGFTIEYSYPDVAYKSTSFSGTEFPNYNVANTLELISRYSLQWSGLLEAEKNTLLNFINSFNNSFQPFTMRIWHNGTTYTDLTLIIEPDTLGLSKDKFDLWSVELNLMEIN